MAHLQIFVALIAGLAISQAFVVPQNDGTSIRDQILNQKFSFLENIFKNSNVDVEAIKAKIKAKDGAEEAPEAKVDGDAIPDDILNNKFAFLENHLKQFNVDVNGIKDRVWASMAEKHSVAKRAIPENGPVDGIAIRDQMLEQKFAFLENLLKQYNVDVAAIKDRIKASTEQHSVAKRSLPGDEAVDGIAIRDQVLEQKFAFLENLLKQYNVNVNAIKERIKASTEQHSVAKRSVTEAGAVDGIAIRDQVLEQKFAFLENLLKQYNVDVNAIKERIKASTEQHSVAKRSVPEGGAVDGIAIRDQVLEQKFAFLENLLKQYNVDVNAIKERIKASTEQHSFAKRSVPEGGAVDGVAIRDQILDEKFEYLSNFLKHLNIDFNAIKERIQASTEAHSVSKRDVREEAGSNDMISNILDTILGSLNSTLKALVDSLITSINKSLNGALTGTDILINLQALLYGLIDQTFPTTSISYTSSLSFGV